MIGAFAGIVCLGVAKPEEDKIIHGSPTRKPNIENDENESKKEL